MVFFSAMPPKASTISVCSATCSQVTLRRLTASIGPSTCGRMHRGGAGAVAVDASAHSRRARCSGSGAPGSARDGSGRRWTSHRSRRRPRSGPCVSRTRASSRASRSSAWSQDTATNSSRPRAVVRAGAVLQPAAADHRPGDARLVAQGARGSLQDARSGRGRPDAAAPPASPSRMPAENAPQCALCGWNSRSSGRCAMRLPPWSGAILLAGAGQCKYQPGSRRSSRPERPRWRRLPGYRRSGH